MCRPSVGEEKARDQVEVKNMNSFRAVKDAIDYEIKRQSSPLNREAASFRRRVCGMKPAALPSRWRSKERPTIIGTFRSRTLVRLNFPFLSRGNSKKPAGASRSAAEPPLIKDYALGDYDAGVLISQKELVGYFLKKRFSICGRRPAGPGQPLVIGSRRAFWGAERPTKRISRIPPLIRFHGELVALFKSGVLSGKMAKIFFRKFISTGASPRAVVQKKG